MFDLNVKPTQTDGEPCGITKNMYTRESKVQERMYVQQCLSGLSNTQTDMLMRFT